ncbi:MAG: winged helix-turn-helix domain-containing protein [Acidimicrobiia bacterium]|nr:winged helix-turn-helix domain-containing protein [Acidimicrobiia bacterium]
MDALRTMLDRFPVVRANLMREMSAHMTAPLTRQEPADLVGITLYTVSRTLSQWETEGILQSQQRQLLIREPSRLIALATES